MKLNAPKFLWWVISLVLGVVGLVCFFIPAVATFAFWIVLVGLALLLVATAVTGM